MKESSEIIRQFLGELLGNKCSFENLNKPPLFLLLSFEEDRVAFADLGQDGAYTAAVDEFRSIYAQHAGDWASSELTLVLCTTHPQVESSISAIETDPFFCRKLVIDLTKDICTELSKLPIVPLISKSGGLRRPLSAQSLLRQHGVHAGLAQALVEPQQKGVDTIIRECLEEGAQTRAWDETKTSDFVATAEEAVNEETRILELEVGNFRCYSGVRKFKLGKSLTVLYGPNGFGKTSFFEAIDFLCTGSVARCDEHYGRNTARLIHSLTFLESRPDQCYVKAYCSRGGQTYTLERRANNRASASLAGAQKQRSQVLQHVTGLSMKNSEIRVENLIRLFRATHLFGQEFQSLTSDFKADSTLSDQIVSRMVALQDYVEAINKTRNVGNELKKRLDDILVEQNTLRESRQSRQLENSRLLNSAEVSSEPASLLEASRQIAKQMTAEAGVSTGVPDHITRDLINDWRGQLAAKIASIERSLALANDLSTKLPAFVRRIAELTDDSSMLEQCESKLSDLEEERRSCAVELNEARAKLSAISATKDSLQAEKRRVDWLIQAKARHSHLTAKIGDLQKVMIDAAARLTTLVSDLDGARSLQVLYDARMKHLQAIADNNAVQLNNVEYLKAGIHDWSGHLLRKADLSKLLADNERKTKEGRAELEAKQQALASYAQSENQIRLALERMERNQSALDSLLGELERHLTDSICPACGCQYGSQEDLLSRLRNRRSAQPENLHKLREEHVHVRTLIESLKAEVSGLHLSLNQLDDRNSRLLAEVDNTTKAIVGYERRIATMNINTADGLHIEYLQKLESDLLAQISAIRNELSEVQSLLTAATSNIQLIQQKVESAKTEINRNEKEASALSIELSQLEGQFREQGAYLDVNALTERARITDIEDIYAAACAAFQDWNKAYAEAQRRINLIDERISAVHEETCRLQDNVSSHQEYIHNLRMMMLQMGSNRDFTSEELANTLGTLKRQVQSANRLYEQVLNLEVTFDASQTSAALASAAIEIDRMTTAIKKGEQQCGIIQGWKTYFDNILEELEDVKNGALQQYVREYGPQASNIQKRLRSVYGFGDISLKADKGQIGVGVDRKGQRLPPSDYFSESQIQIVMLSLFLSANLTQNWSNFAPILMDDPVQHFDDLNCYALVDLVKRLSSHHRRQFLISTCDERLYRLVRQRFGSDPDVEYYEFKSVGDNQRP